MYMDMERREVQSPGVLRVSTPWFAVKQRQTSDIAAACSPCPLWKLPCGQQRMQSGCSTGGSDRIYPLPSPSTNRCFSLPGTNPAMPFSVQGLVLGAPEACSQSPSSQPSRGLLPCTAQQPQPQPPQQPPPQPQGLSPAAQQQPAMSNHMISQVSCSTVSRAQ